MPPKKKQQDAKPKSKAHEDKGFGMKNKNKSKKVQQQINQMKQGVDGGAAKKREAEQKRKAEEKKAAEQAKKEAAALFGIVQPKVPFGVDPKSILCEFFKKGVCTKGNKCKFSHNPEVGRKDVKKDLYTDARAEKEADTMDNWDEEKLRKVILSKHGNPKTKEQKRLERLAKDSEPQITLEEFIEMERGKLDRSKFTPITLETFKEWKKKQRARKEEEKKKENAKRPLTGREIMLKKFADKFYLEEDGDQGDEMDLSEFRSALPNGDEEFKDYGDGSDYDFDEEKKENGEKKDTEKDVVEEKKNVDVEEKENVDVAQVEA